MAERRLSSVWTDGQNEHDQLRELLLQLRQAERSWAIAERACKRLLVEKTAVLAISPADHATTSRDYGRGFAEALRLVHQAYQGTSDD